MRAHFAFVAALILTPAALAAPNEIKVFTDELAEYGGQTLETHVNKASSAGRTNAHRNVPLQAMPEYSYGIWRNWELSFQLPVAESQGGFRSEGLRAELQYVAPHDDERGLYWGVNAELAKSNRLGEERIRDLEVIPILGARVDRWHLVANPGVIRSFNGPERKVRFEPSAKAAYNTSGTDWFGVEYYVEAGPIQHLLSQNQQSKVLYFVWDGKIGKSDINVGIGRGFTDASDRWVLKTVFEFAF